MLKKINVPDKGVMLGDILQPEGTPFEFVPDSKILNTKKLPNYLQYDVNGRGHGSQDQRAFYLNGKHGCLDTGASGKAKVLLADGRVRKLTPIECERLQTVPDNYSAAVSNAQRYRMLGNGWTVDVVAHIFKNIDMDKIKVLSLFDGMSCGQIALNRAGFDVVEYYASEVDKHAIAVTQSNYPKTVQLGDVTKVTGLDVGEIDLLIGGSPCQGFSFAGKQLNFEDPRSKLFFEFVRILKEVKPKYFLLENVKMKKEFQDVITGLLGVEPIEINSALVSAQNRRRLYWTNIPNVTQPEDRGLLLKDVLETSGEGVIKNRGLIRETGNKSLCIDANYFKGVDNHGQRTQVLDVRKKSKCVRSSGRGSYDRHEWDSVDKEHLRKLTPIECERLQTVPDNYTASVSNTQRYRMLGNGWTVDAVAHIFKNISL
jgi:site-specific DNA-cytosine methylase